MLQVPHILKDGADSIGVAGASLRVYVNIGMCGEYWVTRQDPVLGIAKRSSPSRSTTRARTARTGGDTEARMANAESFLKLLKPLLLKDAPAAPQYLTASAETLSSGRRAFAENCAQCHSSKRPPEGTADAAQWFRTAVESPDFLTDNFLSDDKRYSIMRIGTNIARSLGSNATRGNIWDNFSSETYKELPSVGKFTGLYNPRDPDKPIAFEMPAGGRGYYPDAVADQHLGHGAVPAQQLGRRVREGSVGAGTHDGVQRRDREDAVARAPVGRAVDSGHDGGKLRDDQRHQPPGAHPRRHAGGLCGARRSDAAARHRPQQRAAQLLLGRGDLPPHAPQQRGARLRARSRPRVRRRGSATTTSGRSSNS